MAQHDLETALSHVRDERRSFVKKLLLGAGVAIASVPLMTTQALAQKEGEDPGPGGKCDDGLMVNKKSGKCAVPKKKAPPAAP